MVTIKSARKYEQVINNFTILMKPCGSQAGELSPSQLLLGLAHNLNESELTEKKREKKVVKKNNGRNIRPGGLFTTKHPSIQIPHQRNTSQLASQ